MSTVITENDSCDREEFASRDELEREAREMAIRLEDECRERAILSEHEEELRRHEEWLLDFQAGHGSEAAD